MEYFMKALNLPFPEGQEERNRENYKEENIDST